MPTQLAYDHFAIAAAVARCSLSGAYAAALLPSGARLRAAVRGMARLHAAGRGRAAGGVGGSGALPPSPVPPRLRQAPVVVAVLVRVS